MSLQSDTSVLLKYEGEQKVFQSSFCSSRSKLMQNGICQECEVLEASTSPTEGTCRRCENSELVRESNYRTEFVSFGSSAFKEALQRETCSRGGVDMEKLMETLEEERLAIVEEKQRLEEEQLRK